MSLYDKLMLIGIGSFILTTWYFFNDFQVNVKKGKTLVASSLLFLGYGLGIWTFLVRIDALKKYSFTGVISIFVITLIWIYTCAVIHQVKIRRQRKKDSK